MEMMQLSMLYELVVKSRPTRKKIVSIITAIEEARKQIPYDLEDYTFFIRNVTWVYHAVFDTKLCAQCQRKLVPYTYSGLHLRRDFPWLEIETEDRIAANVHPNCRCWLERSDAVPPHLLPEPEPSEGDTWQPEDAGLKRLNPPEDLVRKAIDRFGTTTDRREAGYILPDGTLLDLSGKDEGGTAGMRMHDHREVWDVLEIGKHNLSGTDAMIYFEREANAIRVNFDGRYDDINVSFETAQEPNEQQWNALKRAMREYDNVVYDIYSKDGAVIDSGYIDDARASDINHIRDLLIIKKKEEEIFIKSVTDSHDVPLFPKVVIGSEVEVNARDIAAANVEKFLKELPEKDTEDLRGVKIMKDIPMYHDAAGVYLVKDKIVGYDSDFMVFDEVIAKQVVYHEVGHHVYYDDLSAQQRGYWQSYWQHYINKDLLPTMYSYENAGEGFAECYALYHGAEVKGAQPVPGGFDSFMKDYVLKKESA